MILVGDPEAATALRDWRPPPGERPRVPSEKLIAACLREQREIRPECNWLAVHDWIGTGRVVLVPELPAVNPAVYDAWPWSGLAGYRRTRRELRALGFPQAEAR